MSRIEPKEIVLKDGRKGIIRTAEECDAGQMLKQRESILADAEYLVTTLDDDMKDYTLEKQKERILKHIEGEGKLFILAEVDGQIVASADLRNGERKRIQHIGTFGIIVIKDFRNIGIGKALIQTVIDWGQNNSIIEKIGLGVFANNSRAINLYKKFDFVEEGRRIKEVKIGPDNYIDSILMYKLVE